MRNLARYFLTATFVATAAWGQPGAADPAPDWVRDKPIVMAGSWDHTIIFETRMGTLNSDSAAEIARENSEATVRRLHDLGVNLVILPFFKGFGLNAEKDAIENTRKVIPLLHKYGIKAGVYVGSTIAYETFLAEEPEAKDWFVPDYEGRPVRYFKQYYRKRVYFMHPGYRAYIKRVVRLAIKDLGADLIHFDNTSLQARAAIFHHPMAAADFRDYLRSTYSPRRMRERFGFSDPSHVEPPFLPDNPGPIADPLAQAWADFRCRQLAAYYAEMASYIRSLNPEVADDCNPSSGLSGEDVIWVQGVDYPRLVPQVDFVWSEEGSKVGLDRQGVLWSKIRTYEMATALGRRIFTYTGSDGPNAKLANAEGVDHPRLAMAEAMAFNRGCLGMVCQPLGAATMPAGEAGYVHFFLQHGDTFARSHSLAEVAVLHGYASMGYNTGRPWESTMLVEQALLREHIPFDVLFDSQLSELHRYRVLVLADQEALSDRQLAEISRFVAGGGGVVATGDTALYDENRHLRPGRPPLQRFGGAVSPAGGDPLVERGRLGQGRISFVPAVMPQAARPEDAPMSEAYCLPPLNGPIFAREIRWAGAGLSFSMRARSSVVAAVAEGPDRTVLVHLLNYDPERTPEQSGIAIELRFPDRGKPASVTLYSPDAVPSQVPWTWDGDLAHLQVAKLATYDLIVLSWAPAVSALPPAGKLSLTGGPLMAKWSQAFGAMNPAIRIDWVKPGKTTFDDLDALYSGKVDIAANGFQRELYCRKLAGDKLPGPEPFVIAVSSGGTARHPDRPEASPALGIFVNAANPISCLSLDELDAIFSKSRRRGYPVEIRSWGGLGLKGRWAGEPIHRYGMSLKNQYGQPHGYVFFLMERMLGGGEFKPDLVQVPDTAFGSGANLAFEEILRDVGKDPDGIAFAPFDFATGGVKSLSLSEKPGGRCYAGTREEVARRVYPLTMTNYLSALRPPGRPLDPLVRQFFRYVLSRDGQRLVAETPGNQLPLPADLAAAERAKL